MLIPMTFMIRTMTQEVSEADSPDQRSAHDFQEVSERIVVREIRAIVQSVRIPEHRRREKQKPHARSE